MKKKVILALSLALLVTVYSTVTQAKRPQKSMIVEELPPCEMSVEALKKLKARTLQEDNPEDFIALGEIYRIGSCEDRNYFRARELFEYAYELDPDNKRARQTLVNFYLNGIGGFKDIEKAQKMILQLAEDGDAETQFEVAGHYLNGTLEFEPDIKLASKWFLAAAENGLPQGYRSIGKIYEFGMRTDVNMDVARGWYERGARAGDPFAMQDYADTLYESNDDEAKDRAYEWYKKAIDGGVHSAAHRLSKYYETGRVVPRNDEVAYFYLEIARRYGADVSRDMRNFLGVLPVEKRDELDLVVDNFLEANEPVYETYGVE